MENVLAGGKLQRARMAHVDAVADTREALVLGVGHGRFLPELLQKNREVRVTCLDSSSRMLARARLCVAGSDAARVQFVCEDALTWRLPAARHDLMVSHFFLDCFAPAQLAELIPRMASSMQPGATWLLADFQAPGSGPLRWRAQLILWVMYRFFRLTTALPARRLTDPDALLQANGLHLARRAVSEWGLLRSDVWQRASL